MRTYRYADNYSADGQKRDKEQVFKKDDELPDAVRYAIMAWPRLPVAAVAELDIRTAKRYAAFDERTILDIERVREFNQRTMDKYLTEKDKGYPIGSFFNDEGQGDSSMIW